MKQEPKFLTVKEAAQLLRASPKTIYLWAENRRIPFRRAGNKLLFERGEIEEWTRKSAGAKES
jgi:excisionase family DNA binding protein